MAFCGYLKQSTAVDLPIGPFLDETDGKTAETALTLTQPDIRLKKNAANWAQKNAAQTLSHEENGYYEVSLDATDTNTLGLLSLAVHESGALPVRQDYLVISAAAYDLMFGTLPQGVIAYGTAQAGAAGTIQLAAATSFADDLINGAVVCIIGGTGVGQTRVITDWVSATDTATVSPSWTTTPDNTSVYVVLAAPPGVTATASLPGVNVLAISDTASAADNLETAFATTLAEESAVPAANAPLWTKLNWLFAKGRNKITTTATAQVIRNDADSAAIGTSTLSDDGTTNTRGEFA